MEMRIREGIEMEKFTIGKVAKAADVGVETIRFYEKKGLIVQPQAAGTYREYPKSVVTRISFIKRAKELGFKLSEIRDLLELADQPAEDRAAVKQIAEAKVESIRTRICELRKAEEILAELVDQCSGEGTVHDCPIIEAFGLSLIHI